MADALFSVTDAAIDAFARGTHQPYPDANGVKNALKAVARVRVDFSATAAAANQPVVVSPIKGDVVKLSLMVSETLATGASVVTVTPVGGSAIAALGGTLSGTAVGSFLVKNTDPGVSANSVVAKDQGITIGIATSTGGVLRGYIEIQAN